MPRLAGEAADGWMPHCHTHETYNMDLDTIIGSAHNAGRDFGAFRSAYYTLSSVSKNREEADRNVLGPARYFLALIPQALRKIDPSASHPGRIWEKIPNPKDQRAAIRKIAAELPESDAYKTVTHGTAAHCIEAVEGYRQASPNESRL